MATDCSAHNIALSTASPAGDSGDAQVEVIHDIDPGDSLFVEWQRLAGDTVFHSPRWLLPWWNHYQRPGDRLNVITVRDADGWLIGLAPFYLRTSWRSGRQLHFLGSGEVCSDYLTLLTKRGEESLVVRALAQHLCDQSNEIDRIFLEGVAAEDDVMRQFSEQMAQHQFAAHRLPALESYCLELPAAWENWISQLSKSRRNRVRQLWRKQFDTNLATVHVADESNLKQAFSILVELHQKRRNQMRQPGCFASQQFHDFLWEAAQQLQESNQLRLQWIELEGRPVAVEMDFEQQNALLHYCSGIEIDCEHARPGWLGITAAIRHAIESGKTHFDFLRGDEGYKSHWRGKPVAMVNLDFVAPTFRGRSHAQLREGIAQLKQCAKRVLGKASKSEQTGADSSDGD